MASVLIGVPVLDQNSDTLNRILTAVGLSPVTWQSDPVPAFAIVVLATVR